MSTAQETIVSLAEALTRGASELSSLQVRLEKVEHKLEALYFSAGHSFEPDEISALQEIDVVVQSADALSRYITAIAEAIDLNHAVPIDAALDRVFLRDLADRLRGQPIAERNSGVAELF